MDIRRLKPSDAVEYREMRLIALKSHPEAFASSFEEEKENPADIYAKRFASDESYTFGAFEKEKLIGSVTLLKETKLKLKHRALIVAMYVSDDSRRKGVGKALIAAALDHAKSQAGIEQIYLAVESTNEPAKKLYSSFGFEVFGKDKCALKIGDNYFDEEHMVLVL
ncbi:RimJ/RimL family protein N-acetyltransferase [Cytobacillus eiseniae]|uniref:RimJ/RimL family protein N-acetyltransferase n=1 Tax=Cytobacillus eiseniae TaxID=762947 RepID=A0ABS4RHX0_9BACI|nr:GNAT family N-acetyltransferase [Cytobacillus eiseniae]MBP2241904.1 RimJ/RimL family protein N-acetyltransferase [Cytobacillus eiseniae]